MAPTYSALGIVLTARIERICTGPFEEFEGEVAATPNYAGFLQHRACHAVSNTHDPVSAWQTSLESLG